MLRLEFCFLSGHPRHRKSRWSSSTLLGVLRWRHWPWSARSSVLGSCEARGLGGGGTTHIGSRPIIPRCARWSPWRFQTHTRPRARRMRAALLRGTCRRGARSPPAAILRRGGRHILRRPSRIAGVPRCTSCTSATSAPRTTWCPRTFAASMWPSRKRVRVGINTCAAWLRPASLTCSCCRTMTLERCQSARRTGASRPSRRARRRTPSCLRSWRRRSQMSTASIGATTRYSSTCPRARTRRTPMAGRASSSIAA
mmetsp:Transcript_23047/g.64863  ORF Transcript_23047/g.64863 Transcript_23047/m.64863 type:complete len:255 (+) Transcript_23047:850-1614(+)